MRRTVSVQIAMQLVVVGLGSDSPREYDDNTEVAGIEGTWRLIDEEFNGKKEQPVVTEVMTCRNLTFTSNFNDSDTMQGNYRIDPTHEPPQLDFALSFRSGYNVTTRCIYQIDGNILRIAYIPSARDLRRPKGFAEGDVCVSTYKRVK